MGVAAIVGSWRSRGPIAATGLACAVALVGGRPRHVGRTGPRCRSRLPPVGPVLHDSFGRGDSSSQDRQVLFAEGQRLFWNGTLVGVGPGRTKPTLAAIPAPYVKEAHNDYMATLVELGVLGGVGLVVLIASITVRLARVAGRPRTRGEATAVRDLLPAPQFLVAMGASFLIAGLFYEVLHFRHLWAYLGLLAGLDLIRADSSRPSERR